MWCRALNRHTSIENTAYKERGINLGLQDSVWVRCPRGAAGAAAHARKKIENSCLRVLTAMCACEVARQRTYRPLPASRKLGRAVSAVPHPLQRPLSADQMPVPDWQ